MKTGRNPQLPYGKQSIDDADIEAVVQVLRSERLTCGPAVEAFESAFAAQVQTSHAISISSGTAALHAVMAALGIGEGDEVIVPAITFAATANCVVYCGGTPVFADVDSSTLLIDPSSVQRVLSDKTKAIIAVDYAGQCCNYDALKTLCKQNGIALVADACHSLGGTYKGRSVGSLADISTFSFHPVKVITTGEGGMITTDDSDIADKLRRFRTHGFTSSFDERNRNNTHRYVIEELGYNYRLSDIQAALGRSQLSRLGDFVGRRRSFAELYDERLRKIDYITPLDVAFPEEHAYHLYVVCVDTKMLQQTRDDVFSALKTKNIGVNVHYAPVYYHPFYQKEFNYHKGVCPIAEVCYEEILTLPLFPDMTRSDVEFVCTALSELL